MIKFAFDEVVPSEQFEIIEKGRENKKTDIIELSYEHGGTFSQTMNSFKKQNDLSYNIINWMLNKL